MHRLPYSSVLWHARRIFILFPIRPSHLMLTRKRIDLAAEQTADLDSHYCVVQPTGRTLRTLRKCRQRKFSPMNHHADS
ncbi:MAG: hypothetical protein MUF82_04655 [Bacteroidetes bacterium]|nr:hypothetical protein [Bacteroidota bacterium]